VDSALESMQAAAVGLIQKHPVFAPVPVFYERQKNVRAELAAALNKLKGIIILILTPNGENKTTGAQFVNLGVSLIAEVTENVMANTGSIGTKLPCSFVAEQVAAHLHNAIWTPGKCLVFQDINLIPNKTYLIYRVKFTSNVQLAAI